MSYVIYRYLKPDDPKINWNVSLYVWHIKCGADNIALMSMKRCVEHRMPMKLLNDSAEGGGGEREVLGHRNYTLTYSRLSSSYSGMKNEHENDMIAETFYFFFFRFRFIAQQSTHTHSLRRTQAKILFPSQFPMAPRTLASYLRAVWISGILRQGSAHLYNIIVRRKQNENKLSAWCVCSTCHYRFAAHSTNHMTIPEWEYCFTNYCLLYTNRVQIVWACGRTTERDLISRNGIKRQQV